MKLASVSCSRVHADKGNRIGQENHGITRTLPFVISRAVIGNGSKHLPQCWRQLHAGCMMASCQYDVLIVDHCQVILHRELQLELKATFHLPSTMGLLKMDPKSA